MEAIVIITPAAVELSSLQARLPPDCCVEHIADGRILIRLGGSRAFLAEDPGVRAEMDTRELDAIESVTVEPRFFVLEYQDLETCKNLARAIAIGDDVLIDTDRGAILRAAEFARRLDEDPEWDLGP